MNVNITIYIIGTISCIILLILGIYITYKQVICGLSLVKLKVFFREKLESWLRLEDRP